MISEVQNGRDKFDLRYLSIPLIVNSDETASSLRVEIYLCLENDKFLSVRVPRHLRAIFANSRLDYTTFQYYEVISKQAISNSRW